MKNLIIVQNKLLVHVEFIITPPYTFNVMYTIIYDWVFVGVHLVKVCIPQEGVCYMYRMHINILIYISGRLINVDNIPRGVNIA
jgi:hypothetical protein